MQTPHSTLRVIRATDDPEQFLDWKREVLDADRVDYVKLHPGNVAYRLSKHQNPKDVPCGKKEATVYDYADPPYEINLQELRRRLRMGEEMYQFIFEGYEYLDEEGQASSRYTMVEERPEGWMDVDTVCDLKDQDKSAVTRAIQRDNLTVVMLRSPRKRVIAPDEKFENWNPGRQDNYLMRRRLQIIQELLEAHSFSNLSSLMQMVRGVEIDRHRDIHTYPGFYQHFMERELADCPETLAEWREEIDELVETECR